MPLKCHLITKEARARHGIQALLSRDSRNFLSGTRANLAVGVQLLAEAVKLSETRLIWGNHGLAGCDFARLLNRYYIGDCSASSSHRERPTLKAWNEKLFLHHRHNQYRHHNVLSTFFQVQSLVSLLARAFPPTCGHDIGVGNSPCQACKNAHSY